jgi:hypothetical protein
MSGLSDLHDKFNGLLENLNATSARSFCNTVESAYEALVLASVMTEYARLKGGVASIFNPPSDQLLNLAPGRFSAEKAFLVFFNNGESFFFAADVEIFGLLAKERRKPGGMLFEADVVVIPEKFAGEVLHKYNGYPAPMHLDSVYECKFGQYNKGQLRELLGLRRHISYLTHRLVKPIYGPNNLFNLKVQNSYPPVPVNLVRPAFLSFFDVETTALYDLQQLVVI